MWAFEDRILGWNYDIFVGKRRGGMCMDWMQSVQKAINYIEDNLCEELDIEKIAGEVYSSSANFQRIFSIVMGITIGDYIRYRRLTLAGKELFSSKEKIVSIALKYGYETAESFTKSFVRFHGITPSAAKKSDKNLKNFTPLSIQIDIRGGFDMKRKLLSNVPLITISTEDMMYLTSFTGALYGALKSLGEECTYSQLLAYSGFGNRFCHTEGKWIFGDEDIENYNETPFENQIRLLNIIGWKVKIVSMLKDENGNLLNIDETQIRNDFIDSISKGMPVLAQGITDNGCKTDYNVFYGYEDDGEKIIGWDYYQNDSQPFVRSNWENELKAYILLIEKVKNISEKESIISAFKMIIEYAEKNEIKGRKVGFAAWEAFLNQLENDDFSNDVLLASEEENDDPQNVKSLERKFIIYCDALCQIFQRKGILEYYKSLIEKYPQWSNELNIAINAWEECSAYGGFLWSQGFTFDAEGFKKFADPQIRKILADEGRKAMQKDKEAIEQIKAILKKNH